MPGLLLRINPKELKVETHTDTRTQTFTTPFLSTRFSGINYIHGIMQPSPLATSKNLPSPQTLYPLSNNSPYPPPPAPGSL